MHCQKSGLTYKFPVDDEAAPQDTSGRADRDAAGVGCQIISVLYLVLYSVLLHCTYLQSISGWASSRLQGVPCQLLRRR
jgi:hypothetical protein